MERTSETSRQSSVFASTHTSYGREEDERDDRADQVYALTTHQLQVERRESPRADQVYALNTHQLQVERKRDIERSSVACAHHTPATGREERERHRADQVYALHTHSYRGEERET